MTYEEAIELIKINVCYKQNVCDDGICKSTEDKPCAIDVVIEALGEQIPKKPIKSETEDICEAIEHFEKLEKDAQNDCLYVHEYLTLEDLCVAIDSIKKQIPQNIIDDEYLEAFFCPHCGVIVKPYYLGKLYRCQNCGQALDWPGEE